MTIAHRLIAIPALVLGVLLWLLFQLLAALGLLDCEATR